MLPRTQAYKQVVNRKVSAFQAQSEKHPKWRTSSHTCPKKSLSGGICASWICSFCKNLVQAGCFLGALGKPGIASAESSAQMQTITPKTSLISFL